MLRIPKKQLAENLNRILREEVGKKGLNTLIHGWFVHMKYGAKYREAVYHRSWLYITEAQELSRYAGYDLTKNET